MRGKFIVAVGCCALAVSAVVVTARRAELLSLDELGQAQAQQQAPPAGQPQAAAPAADDPVRTLVGRLDLEKYKATIKGLTQFGDRREGTARNRKAVDWIAEQLKSYGCAPERMEYEVAARGGGGGGGGGRGGDPARAGGAGAAGAAGAGAAGAAGAGAAGAAGAAGGQAQAGQQGQRGGGGQAGQGRGGGGAAQPPAGLLGAPGRAGRGSGGSTIFGYRGRTGVSGAAAQPDERLRALNSEPVIPGPIPQVFCTKVGSTRPDEMYILGGHMDGIGYGEGANDDASGTALVMELARIFSSPDVVTERTIRFALWNGEEGGLRGANAYVNQRRDRQGKEEPAGSGRYPEPKWLGMVQHDKMLWDHGMPRPDGTVSREQRLEADVNIEFQSTAKMADEAQKLAWFFKAANEQYATDYPAAVGNHMTNTDSGPFMNIVAAISLRENERGSQIGAGWDPNWHQPTDLYTTYYDKDFLLGLNAAQTTLAAIAQLTGAKMKK
jgi:hypothetical protein